MAGTCFGTQAINAQVPLVSPLRDNDLQAQLPSSGQQLQLRNVQVNADGFVLQINGSPQMRTSRVANPDRIILDLQATEVSPYIHNSVVPINRYGVRQIRVAQFQKYPAITRLVFDLDSTSPVNWQSSYDQTRGLLLLRPVGLPVTEKNTSLPVTSSSGSNNSLPTTINGLSFNGYGQLVIDASRAITYRSSLDLANNTYSLTIPATRISSQLRRPVLGANSPIEQIRLTQVGDAVVVSVKMISGWQISEAVRTNPQAIALQLTSVRQVNAGIPPNTQSQVQPNYGNVTSGRQLVVIDPGHGGPDVGATRNGVYEKDIVLAMSKQLGRILQQMGYSVMYTRTEDIDLDLEPRVQMAENARASAFVSVHVNSLDASSSQVNGVETYHAPSASLGKNLAELVHQQIIASTGANDRGVRSARFYVITKTSMPAILVETGFITNPSEASRLVDGNYQGRMAAAIAQGIDQFLKSYRR